MNLDLPGSQGAGQVAIFLRPHAINEEHATMLDRKQHLRQAEQI